ncbi:UNVERIFIED_CONTAM: hypothetical protein FKN15_035903 [Acipenser sinensis]
MSHSCVCCRWGILFSHPRDFTPVCTTELGRAAKLSGEFARRSVKMIALSIDSVQDHLAWSKDIVAYNGEAPDSTLPFPIIADEKRELAIQLGMLDPDEKDKDGIPLTARCVSDTTPNPLSRCRDGSKTPPAQRFHPFQEWGILFSHPRDFTPVCTTELGRAAKLSGEFARRSVKMIALSIDSVQDHLAWSKAGSRATDIVAYNGEAADSTLPFPIIADEKRELAIQLGMLDPDEKDKDGIPLTARCLGDSCMVLPNIPEDEAAKLFPAGVYTKDLPSGKKYLRYTPQP